MSGSLIRAHGKGICRTIQYSVYSFGGTFVARKKSGKKSKNEWSENANRKLREWIASSSRAAVRYGKSEEKDFAGRLRCLRQNGPRSPRPLAYV